MSKIDEQIKALQLKKKKIEFLNHILSSAKDYNHEDFKDVKDEVVSSLESFIVRTINSIESDSEIQLEASISKEDLDIIKTVADKVKSKNKEVIKSTKSSVSNPVVDNNIKLKFAMDNRVLANKKVTIANDQNLTITGTVVGLDAPDVIVRTDSGPIVKVPLEKVSL